MLAHRLRRWPNSEPALGERLVFAGTVNGSTFIKYVPWNSVGEIVKITAQNFFLTFIPT